MKRYVSEYPACPNCGDEWAYEADGRVGSRVIAIYSREQDRTVAWRCPACGQEWPRGALIDGWEGPHLCCVLTEDHSSFCGRELPCPEHSDGALLVVPGVGGDISQPLASVGRFDDQGRQGGVDSEDQREHVPVGDGVIEAEHPTIMHAQSTEHSDGADVRSEGVGSASNSVSTGPGKAQPGPPPPSALTDGEA